MPTYFVIDELKDGYSWYDFEVADLGFDYAIDALDIPEEYIETVELLSKEKIEITLIDNQSFTQEDWYYVLLPYAA
ncbi:MAG: hypothetical protein U9P71_01935 [Campylobacterota bacterium]|nr:hypothetical protein [Campylobacterota bacterium]